jgi:hypothetical protein
MYPSQENLSKIKGEQRHRYISPYDHKTPPPPLQLSVDIISYAKTAIDGLTSEYDKQDHLTKKNGDNNNDERQVLWSQ